MQCDWCNNYVISLKLQSILDDSMRDPRKEPHEDPALSLEAALVGHRFKDSLAMEQTVLIEVTKVEELN